MKRRDGFTLLELLVVVGLIGILMALLLPAIIKAKDKGKEKRITVNASAISTAIDAYKSRYHKWPAKDSDLEAGKDVYYGNDTGYYYPSDDDKKNNINKFGCGGDNSIVVDKLAHPPDGKAGPNHSDDPFIDLSDYIVGKSSGNVLTKVKEAGAEEVQFRITLDLDGNYLPSGGVAIDGVHLPVEGAEVKDYYGVPE